MKQELMRVAISGVSGRMGRQLIRSIKNSKDIVLGAALAHVNSNLCGIDVGEYIGIGSMGVCVNSSLEDVIDLFDVLIDFTSPEATLQYLFICDKFKKNIVIGTTGFTDDQLSFIFNCSKNIGIVLSSNFSVGINVMLHLLKKITVVMGQTTDIKIFETHHKNKVDVPSGTALSIKKSIIDVLISNFDKVKMCAKVADVTTTQKLDAIDIISLRVGSIVGEHDVCFFGMDESISISHKTYNRSVFSEGAIRAAVWLLVNNKIGLFSMSDVLEIN